MGKCMGPSRSIVGRCHPGKVADCGVNGLSAANVLIFLQIPSKVKPTWIRGCCVAVDD